MPHKYQVEQITGKRTFTSKFGPLLEWSLAVRNLSTDSTGPVTVNSKPDKAFIRGQIFWAEPAGEYAGIPKLKRVAEPPEASAAPATQPAGSTSHGSSSAVPYEKALLVYRRFAGDLREYPPEYPTTLFIAWLRGQVGDPGEVERPLFDEGPPNPDDF